MNQKIWLHWFLCVVLPCSTDISASAELVPARILVSGPPKYPWSTAEAEIAPPLKPEKSISNETLLHASGGATPCIADISANPDPSLARIRVSGPPKYTWSTVKAEIAPPRRPKLQILNLGLLCCWRGALISVYILASTHPLRARFPSRVYAWKIRVWYDAWETWSVPWKLKKLILWWAHHIPIVNFWAISRGYNDFDSFQLSNMPSLECRINSVFDILHPWNNRCELGLCCYAR